MGDEGLCSKFKTSEEVLDLIILSERTGLIYLDDMSIALDCAASELFSKDSYKLTGEKKIFVRREYAGTSR